MPGFGARAPVLKDDRKIKARAWEMYDEVFCRLRGGNLRA